MRSLSPTDRGSVVVLDPASITPLYDVALCKALHQSGWTTRLLASRFTYEPSIFDTLPFPVEYAFFSTSWPQHTIFRRAYRLSAYPFDQFKLYRKFKKNRPSVIHIQWSMFPVADLRFIQGLRALEIPVVHTVHDVEPLTTMGGKAVLSRLYSEVDALVVHSDINKQSLLQRYPQIVRDRVHVIGHGPLQADSTPPEATRSSARAALGIPQEAKVVLFFGGIRAYKGLQGLVNAFATAARKDSRLYLLVAGPCRSREHEPDISPLEGLQNQFKFKLAFIPTTDVWKYYLSTDVVVLPYEAASQSGVLLTAMAHARPVITTDVGALPELVRDSACGWSVPRGDTNALATAIQAAFESEEELRIRGFKGQNHVKNHLSWFKIARRTINLYQMLMGESSTGSISFPKKGVK